MNRYPNLIISIRESAFTSLITNFTKLHDNNDYKGSESLTIKKMKEYISDYLGIEKENLKEIEKIQSRISKKKLFTIRHKYLAHHDMDNLRCAALKEFTYRNFKNIKKYLDDTHEILNIMGKLVGKGTFDLSNITIGIQKEIYEFLDNLSNKK